MKQKKISFQNIKDVLSREEMKRLMAGSGGIGEPACTATTITCNPELTCSCPANSVPATCIGSYKSVSCKCGSEPKVESSCS